jgi:hypothetical protein
MAVKICKAHTLTLVKVSHGAGNGPEAINCLGHPHEEGILQRTMRESIQKPARVVDLEYADRVFISPFRRVDYPLAHLGIGFCCANRLVICKAGTSPGAL